MGAVTVGRVAFGGSVGAMVPMDGGRGASGAISTGTSSPTPGAGPAVSPAGAPGSPGSTSGMVGSGSWIAGRSITGSGGMSMTGTRRRARAARAPARSRADLRLLRSGLLGDRLLGRGGLRRGRGGLLGDRGLLLGGRRRLLLGGRGRCGRAPVAGCSVAVGCSAVAAVPADPSSAMAIAGRASATRRAITSTRSQAARREA